MIQGKVANGMYWGGILVLVTCIIGAFVLAGIGAETPPEIIMTITAVIGFLFGTHVAPTRKLNDKTAKFNEPLVIEETDGTDGKQ